MIGHLLIKSNYLLHDRYMTRAVSYAIKDCLLSGVCPISKNSNNQNNKLQLAITN